MAGRRLGGGGRGGGRAPGSLGRWAAWLLWRGRLAAGRPGLWVAWVLSGVAVPFGVLAVVGGVLAWPWWGSGVLLPGLGVAWALGGGRVLVGLVLSGLGGLGGASGAPWGAQGGLGGALVVLGVLWGALGSSQVRVVGRLCLCLGCLSSRTLWPAGRVIWGGSSASRLCTHPFPAAPGKPYFPIKLCL